MQRCAVPPRFRHPAAAAAVIGVALLAAACHGSPSSAAGSPRAVASTGQASAAAFSVCMRSHGVPNFPDPDSKGRPPQADPQQLGVSTSVYQAAEQACRSQLPTGGSLDEQTQQCVMFGYCPQALLQQLLTVERRYAQCMRSHGAPNWPDPEVGAKGRPDFDLTSAGIDPQVTDTPQFRSQDLGCRRAVGGSVPTLPTT